MTILDFSLFARTPLREFHGRGWLTGGSECPNLMRTIGLFNSVSRILATALLRSPSEEERCWQLVWWVRVIEALVGLNNFSSVVALMAGLAMSPVYRLNRTWDLFKSRFAAEHALMEKFEQLTSSQGNWTGLRGAVHSVQPPCVPYLGVYCSDLTFVDQGNPSRLPPHGLVNWDKGRLEANIIRELNLFQLSAYQLRPVPRLQEMLLRLDQLDDDSLYALSLEREPRKR